MQVVQQPKQQPTKQQQVFKVKLNQQLVKKYQQVFKSFQKQQDSGYVQTKDIPAAMKILGATITQQQIIQMLGDRVNRDENPLISSKIDFNDFLTLFIRKQNQIAMKQQLMEAFKVFDTDSIGTISIAQMRYNLRTYGIAMAQDQVQQLLKQSQPEQGQLKYQKFINKLLGIAQQ